MDRNLSLAWRECLRLLRAHGAVLALPSLLMLGAFAAWTHACVHLHETDPMRMSPALDLANMLTCIMPWLLWLVPVFVLCREAPWSPYSPWRTTPLPGAIRHGSLAALVALGCVFLPVLIAGAMTARIMPEEAWMQAGLAFRMQALAASMGLALAVAGRDGAGVCRQAGYVLLGGLAAYLLLTAWLALRAPEAMGLACDWFIDANRDFWVAHPGTISLALCTLVVVQLFRPAWRPSWFTFAASCIIGLLVPLCVGMWTPMDEAPAGLVRGEVSVAAYPSKDQGWPAHTVCKVPMDAVLFPDGFPIETGSIRFKAWWASAGSRGPAMGLGASPGIEIIGHGLDGNSPATPWLPGLKSDTGAWRFRHDRGEAKSKSALRLTHLRLRVPNWDHAFAPGIPGRLDLARGDLELRVDVLTPERAEARHLLDVPLGKSATTRLSSREVARVLAFNPDRRNRADGHPYVSWCRIEPLLTRQASEDHRDGEWTPLFNRHLYLVNARLGEAVEIGLGTHQMPGAICQRLVSDGIGLAMADVVHPLDADWLRDARIVLIEMQPSGLRRKSFSLKLRLDAPEKAPVP